MLKIRILLMALLPTFLLTACDPPRPQAETWAWCGVHPDEPTALARATTLRNVAGIDASLGPCLPPPANYTPSNPGSRYLDPAGYKRAVLNNAAAGMKTIVYDARIWSTDPAIRQTAITFWQPHLANIRAWDMGDEFDPASPEWATLVSRWNTVLQYVTPATGVGPFSNHLPWALDDALRDMPAHVNHLGYDLYNVEWSLAIARDFDSQTNHLMCAINALAHGPYIPTPIGITAAMLDHRDAGCDSFLIFGGDMPYATPGFGTPSLVNSNGTPTPLAQAVYDGSL